MNLPAHVVPVLRAGAGEPADAAPDRIVSGSGASTVWNAFTDAAGRFHAGHWSSEAGVRRVEYTETELCVLLEGRVRLEGTGGAVEFGPGEAFVIAAGFRGVWESLGRVTKIYAVLEP
ncbi:cupin domain-containing protein [Amaricoccus sp.]|uniref:cupin domain-containing protein n=1 Tax=Amaricoccus sp. TaxID=1872485 RepID=UPI001B6994F0|nr:cupin domain-containing protein [Amaricoccus sp.]MBP7241340.1 DUF861 domain-containing protein [Amaricoccus sp.]